MRILAAPPFYPPASRVGAWLATHQLLVHLVRRGHHVTVMPISGRTEGYTHEGVEIVPFERGRDLEHAIAKADLVVSHCGDNGVPARFAAKADVANVRLAHGDIADPAVLDGAALIVFNSHTLADSIEHTVPSIVVHPPVFADEYRTTPGECVTLVNLAEAKGGELFWRLVRCSARRFLGVKGHYGHQYVARRSNADVIETTDNMRDDVYARTRILLMPSERETWGMTAVEAMASGIPVVAHPTPGLLESLDSAGIFVDREDGQGWLDQIERLHDPQQWATASAAALARSAELDPAADLERFATAIEQLHCTGGPA